MSKVITEINSTVNELFAKSLVTQKFSNTTENPLELKIYLNKSDKLLFSSFICKIGDSIEVKSKVIKKEKAEVKYTDNIAKGNAAIFVSQDPENENRTIINMGNIPPKNDVILITEFIHFVEATDKYEFEFFRNLPIFKGGEDIYQNSELKGKVQIMAKNEIINIEKKILMNNLKITEEKYENDKKTKYIILYEIDKLPEFYWNRQEYIPCSKIFFDSLDNKPFIYRQESSLKENNYVIHYRYKKEKTEKDEEEFHPAIFIFLLDQSGSMSGSRITIALKALELFIQSLPAGSYYQIIGFGSDYKVYDDSPKEYNLDNIKKSLEMIKKLSANLGGTNIEGPLKYVYDSNDKYEKIKLPRNIILLTDGEAWDKEKGLILIEKNNSKFTLHSIGIGDDFDEGLIKNSALLGRGNYNFCKNLENLNNIIASEINKATSSYVSNIHIKSELDDKNKIKNSLPNILRNNSLINLYYILDNNIDTINLNIKYDDKENDKEKTIEKKYEIIPELLEKGDDLSKLIIYNYINNDRNISEEEKIKLALKYQIFMKNTSLFAEVAFSEKITEEMKLKILGNKEDNVIPILRREEYYERDEMCCADMACDDEDECDIGCCYDDDDVDECCMSSPPARDYCYEKGSSNSDKESDEEQEKKEAIKQEEKSNGNEKENIMEMVGTQNFVEGYWEENERTKKIKTKYEKEYEQIKGIKDKNMNDTIALTILIIYFLNKEYPDLISELIMIIKKAKQFILKQTKDSYDNIIKELGLN